MNGLRELLDEVRCNFTRDDDLPNDLLPRIEAALASSPATVELGGLTYGIIDPDYARVFTIARCLAWAEGYALMMHGSFTRDLDLVAIPWADRTCEPEHLVRRILDAANLRITAPDTGDKLHGRMAWTLSFKTFGDPRFIDLSITPRLQKFSKPDDAAKP